LLERVFGLRESGTTAAREVRAGAVTFLTMAYILAVNPQILGAAGMPVADVAVATALAAALGSILMGLWARYPFALAPGMGLNAYFAFGVVGGLGVSWQVALTAVFVEGLLFVGLAAAGLRRAVLEAVPLCVKQATMAGIGLFIAFIGLQNGGLVVADAGTAVRLGDPASAEVLLTLAGLLVVVALSVRRVPGAILITVAGCSAVAWAAGWALPPQSWFSSPALPRETLFALDFSALAAGGVVAAVLAFFFVDLLDTTGTLIGVGMLGGFVGKEGDLPRADRAFLADAVATTAGALVGTSTVTTYIESAAGVEEGGRTGLTAVTVGVLFLLAIPLAPVFVAVPAMATAPVLVLVGAAMMRGVTGVDWRRLDEAVPAFLTVVGMPFTFSIANGLALGIVSWVGIRLLGGRLREIGFARGVLAALLVVFVFFLGPGRSF
jgi:AGZA family xanthine/uracil permease-like MFS transporter